MKLKLSPTLSMPSDAVTRTFGILATRGAGKSNTAVVMAEEMYEAGLPFVVIDPEGSWWGLRASEDGKSPGLPIPILGGRHGDIPLEREGGRLVADLVVDNRMSCILDLDSFESERARKHFLLDFAVQLYKRNADPLHLFLEEADDYIPQKPMKEEAQLLRAWENIVRRGRKRGLGMTMITQRSAVINKNVLTQIETLIVMRTTSPQDRKAILAWVDYHGQSREILESLPSLEDGEAWIWSPQWLKKVVRTQIRLRETYDSAATPKQMSKRPVATLADVDLAAFQKRMTATIERAKAEDPKELKHEIAKLRAQLAKVPVAAEPVIRVIEKPILSNEQLKSLREMSSKMNAAIEGIISAANGNFSVPLLPARLKTMPVMPLQRPSTESLSVRRGERKILIALAQHPDGCTKEQITVLTGYKRSSRDTYLQRLTFNGYVDRFNGRLVCTYAGRDALGDDFEPLPVGEALRVYWMQKLPAGEKAILELLIGHYPNSVDKEVLSETTGYQRSSRDTYLQRLSARELITRKHGHIYASEQLFSP